MKKLLPQWLQSYWQEQRDNFFASVLVFVAVGALASIPVNVDFLNPFVQAFADFELTDIAFSRLRAEKQVSADTNIVIVNIGKLPRPLIAAQIERLEGYNPKVIGIDAFFRQPKTDVLDSALVRVLNEQTNIVLVSKLSKYNTARNSFDSLETSHPIFTHKAAFAFANVIADSVSGFNTVREFSPKETARVRGRDSVQYAFSVELARRLNPDAAKRFLERNTESEIINFRGNYGRFYTLDVQDVLDPATNLDFVRGKIVLMGYMGATLEEQSLEDVFYTPMNPRNVGKTLPDMYGIVVHANIISMILHEAPINKMSSIVAFLLAVVICYLNMVLFHYLLDAYSPLYQVLSLIVQIIESVMLLSALVYILDELGYKADFTLSITIIALSAGVFELYAQSLKPLLLTLVARLRASRR
ncbi:MAG: CHASE2 domain-containing protein [Candidatus Kapaibacteriota bacterium]